MRIVREEEEIDEEDDSRYYLNVLWDLEGGGWLIGIVWFIFSVMSSFELDEILI